MLPRPSGWHLEPHRHWERSAGRTTSQNPEQRQQRELRTDLQPRSPVAPRLGLPQGDSLKPLALQHLEAVALCPRGQGDGTRVPLVKKWIQTALVP